MVEYKTDEVSGNNVDNNEVRAGFSNITDETVMLYFKGVRRFDLLTREQEKALCEQIKTLQIRKRRALVLSPVAFPWLSKKYGQIETGELTPGNILVLSKMAGSTLQLEQFRKNFAALVHIHERIRKWQEIRTRRTTNRRSRTRSRIQYKDALRETLVLWEELQLQPEAYEMLALKLARACDASPDDPALRRSQAASNRYTREHHEAKARLCEANLRMVIYIAKRYACDDVPLLDLIQEGNIGLMRAIEKFDYDRGFKFITYAYWWVRQMVGRYVTDNCRTVRVPSHIIESRQKIQSAFKRLGTTGSDPTTEAIAADLGWTPDEVSAIIKSADATTIPFKTAKPDGELFEERFMKDTAATPPLECLIEKNLRKTIATILENFSPRDAEILRLRFGLDDEGTRSLQEIGVLYGLSRERIRQIEKKVLTCLKEQYGDILGEFLED